MLVDVSHRHGVTLGFLMGLEGDHEAAPLDQVVLPPRVALIRKNQVAVITEVDEAITGIAWTLVGTCSADALIARADEAMYRSKRFLGGAPTLAPEAAMGLERRT